MAVNISSVFSDIPRKPAASHVLTPICMSQVAAVWRSVCGLILPSSRNEGFLKSGLDRLYWPPVELDEMLL